MHIFLKALLLSAPVLLARQQLQAQDYMWQDEPVIHKVPEIYKKESAVFILEKHLLQYVPDEQKEDIDVYRTTHRIIRLLDDKGVEYFNKMTIASPNGATITAIKGRTIKAGGKVISLSQEQIRTNKDENGQLQYHLAFEGVEKGDEVEMFYTEKRPFSLFGTEILQYGLPVAKASFRLEAPEYLYFDTKGYNGFPDMKDTVIRKQHYYTAELDSLDAMEEEQYSDLTPNLKRIEYKLSYSGYNSNVRRYTWNDLVKHMYEKYYNPDDRQLRLVRKFMEPLNLANTTDEEEKIRRIEDLIKRNIVYDEAIRDEKFEEPAYIIDKKTSGESGMISLFAACFKEAGVNFEVGLSSNRFEYPVDDKFENWNRPDLYVLYFPKTKQYLAPTASTLRYPAIPSVVRENKGIFCKTTTVGNLTTALASVRTIPALPMEQSATHITADIRFDQESMAPLIKLTHADYGYPAFGMREAVTYIPKDKETELVQNALPGLADQPEDILSYSFNNKGLEHYSDNKPVEIICELKAEQLMETAGGKWLFKVGDVIGPQAEMYQDKKRKLPISMPYPHSLIRDITVNVPEGYKITNPEAAKIQVKDKDNTMGFSSDYTLEGKKMTIHINEFYSRTGYPASEIESFRKVINAAADFNKVTLVMEKE